MRRLNKPPFLGTSEQSDLKPENRDHFYILFYSVIPSFYTSLRKEKMIA
jgi:hypothetical protein